MKTKYDKLDLAEKQLEAAVLLYLNHKDYISASTLAGAAGEIFHKYLKFNNGHTIARGVANVFKEVGVGDVKIKKVYSALRSMSINHLKHRKHNDPLDISLDFQREALDNVIMAMIDYKEIFYGVQRQSYINPLSNAIAGEYIKKVGKEDDVKKKSYKTIALTQLKSSIKLFSSEQYAASITLAGAADDILISLLETKGKKCLSKIAKENKDSDATVGEIRKEMNDLCAINAIKHLDSLDDRYIETNILEDAYTAILKTLPNYMNLDSNSYSKCYEVSWFLHWAKKNLDPAIYHTENIKIKETA